MDDDCDNIIDNNIPEVGDDCEIGKGICHSTGVYFCDQAKLEIECDAKEIKSKIETCNGLDDSCNGLTDEGFDDTDFDGAANCVDTDDDGDGVIDENDNCPLAYNPLQEDTDERR
ncbi:MAG: hypothetical protein HYU98_02535 [Deltaproteobacteria bacterium]|nr:hypothetical protein [Deltaproteobacteria bacterium]